jgi:serine/threonine-protein phosphatase 2B catalytic subunit
MLMAMLGICSKEELEEDEKAEQMAAGNALPDVERTRESDDSLMVPSHRLSFSSAEEKAARRKAIKQKILAIGKMSRVFSVLRSVFPAKIVVEMAESMLESIREEAESVSELKTLTGTTKLPYG